MTPPRPAPPPLPPADLRNRRLPTVRLRVGTMLYRIHRTGLGIMHFGRALDPDERQRWDSPDSSYGVWYAGEPDYVAFAETLLRDLTLTSIPHDALVSRSFAEVRVCRDLTVANFADAGLFKLGADSSVADAEYQVTWAWSAAIHGHPQGVDGIRYRARHDNSGISYAFFDRAADAFDPGTSVPLLGPQNAVRLGAWLDRYGLGLGS